MSSALLPLVGKFPQCTREERALLLDFARTTPLHYGAWKTFKLLFKKAEAAFFDGTADAELLAALVHRVDDVGFTRVSIDWEAVEQKHIGGKLHSVSGSGFTYTVGGRSRYDRTGWRLVITSDTNTRGALNTLRRALKLPAISGQGGETVAFDFYAGSYIDEHEVKSVSLEGSELKILCGPSWRGATSGNKSFIVDVSDPNFIHLRDDGPKTPTLQYMKRRARRILRHASTRNPELYLQLAVQLLRERGDKPLDAALNWAAMDVLFARSPRWKQTHPGRGPYRKVAGQFLLKRREERAPEIWDAHLEVARELLGRGDVPIQANEAALKILREHNEISTPQVLASAQLLRFLESDVPTLQSLATRQLAQSDLLSDGALWARLTLLANARTRRTLNENVAANVAGNATWSEAAARVLSEALNDGAATRKRRAAQGLVERFADHISGDMLWRRLDTFADVGLSIRAWLISRVEQSGRNGEFARLSNLAFVRPELHQIFLDAFSEGARDAAVSVESAFPLVAGNDQGANSNGWHFLATTTITQEIIRELWYRVWSTTSGFARQVHETAAQNESASQMFERAGFSSDELATWLPKIPFFQEALSPAFFAAVCRRLNAPAQIDLALTSNDEQWEAARETLVQTLRNPELLGDFWARVLARIAAGEDESLSRRILDDVEIGGTFTRVSSDTIAELLQQTNPAHEAFLLRWLDANLSQLARGDAALLASATHPFAMIRARGLARIEQTGLDLPLALRLLESGLPQPFEMARRWFTTNESLDLADRALALCDSPDANVRAFGREFLEANAARVLDANILKKLSENSDPQMQAWLAEHLLKDASGVEVGGFDQTILKTRGRARRAKEAVKKRRETTQNAREYSQADIAALLDVARGRTSRDREWALQQLAQAALAGQEIDGLEVRPAGGQ